MIECEGFDELGQVKMVKERRLVQSQMIKRLPRSIAMPHRHDHRERSSPAGVGVIISAGFTVPRAKRPAQSLLPSPLAALPFCSLGD
jgi:hypothetical protein